MVVDLSKINNMAKYILAALAAVVSLPNAAEAKGTPMENYSFDYSAHQLPIGWTTMQNAVALHDFMKLNSAVEGRGGTILLERPLFTKEIELDIEFQLNSNPDTSRGFEVIFNQNFYNTHEFEEAHFGYRSDYEGIGVYVFRSNTRQNKWYVMTLQGNGAKSVFKQPKNMGSGLTSQNSCLIDVKDHERMGVRITLTKNEIITEIEGPGEYSFKAC